MSKATRPLSAAARAKKVDLLPTIELLHQHVTSSLCGEVFQSTRITEREREWSLQALSTFWIYIILRAPASLRAALQEAQGLAPDAELRLPVPDTSFQAFSKRCQTLRPAFLGGVFHRFVAAILPDAPPAYNDDLQELRDAFPEVLLLDGSRLDRIAHRLKITHKTRAVLLPGAIEVAYDLWRGIPRQVDFTADAAEYEGKRADRILPNLPQGSLVIADRLYAAPQFLRRAVERGIAVVTRPNNTVNLEVVKRLSYETFEGGKLEDYLVTAGPKDKEASPLTLRWIRWQKNSTIREILTTVQEPEKLGPKLALRLYARRWKIERMFFDLKEVMNLHEFYADNPHGVAMQVYAAAIVYTAMRIAQARIAKEHRITPEQISVPKLYPRIAAASQAYVTAEWFMVKTKILNKTVEVRFPRLRDMPLVQTTLGNILVAVRKDTRTQRRYCKSRGSWKSFRHIPGGPNSIFLNN